MYVPLRSDCDNTSSHHNAHKFRSKKVKTSAYQYRLVNTRQSLSECCSSVAKVPSAWLRNDCQTPCCRSCACRWTQSVRRTPEAVWSGRWSSTICWRTRRTSRLGTGWDTRRTCRSVQSRNRVLAGCLAPSVDFPWDSIQRHPRMWGRREKGCGHIWQPSADCWWHEIHAGRLWWGEWAWERGKK